MQKSNTKKANNDEDEKLIDSPVSEKQEYDEIFLGKRIKQPSPEVTAQGEICYEVFIIVHNCHLFLASNYVLCKNQITKKKKVSVSKFKGKVIINFREFYEKDGNLLPTKKGKKLNFDPP